VRRVQRGDVRLHALRPRPRRRPASASHLVRKLEEYAPDVPIFVKRLAVTPKQIATWNLPTRPGKTKDPDARKWGNRPNVELDTIDPARLNALVDHAIRRHVDEHAWEVEQAFETEEREGLRALASAWRTR
jgi:hypothetical protein